MTWWPEGFDNLSTPLAVSAFCACSGPTLVTAAAMLECVGGDHHWIQNDRRFCKFVVPDHAQSFLKLTGLAFDHCRVPA